MKPDLQLYYNNLIAYNYHTCMGTSLVTITEDYYLYICI